MQHSPLALPPRRRTPPVRIGRVIVGGDAPISVQTMTKGKTTDPQSVIREIESTVNIDVERDLDPRSLQLLKDSGLFERAREMSPISCDLTRVSVPDDESADCFSEILAASPVPVVADIHFKQTMALRAIDARADKIRLNPGNIRNPKLIRRIAQGCKDHNLPIRVGVNSGSLAKDLRDEYGDDNLGALVASAVRSCEILEEMDFHNIIVSLKATRADLMIEAYRRFATLRDYPLHLGVTEAGVGIAAITNSFAGIGSLLLDGIGDTIRVSLTENAALEVVVGRLLVDAVNRKRQAACTASTS